MDTLLRLTKSWEPFDEFNVRLSNLPSWAVTVTAALVLLGAAAWLLLQRHHMSCDRHTATEPALTSTPTFPVIRRTTVRGLLLINRY